MRLLHITVQVSQLLVLSPERDFCLIGLKNAE